MGYYVLAVGGTGNKILESLVYLAAVDGLYTQDESGKTAPLPDVTMLSVDVDTACGNTTRAKRAAESYGELQRAFRQYPAEHPGFHTALQLERWSMNLSRRAMSVDKMVENHRRDQLLSRTLFSRTESALEYSEGFRGHPDLGVLFFHDLLNSLDDLRREGQPDEMNRLLDQIQAELDRDEPVKLILCGSIFGGTGASGIPAVARFLRKRFAARSDRFEMGALLMLPYYRVPASLADEDTEIVVKSDDFLDKARTALQYYGMEGMIRDGEQDENGVFDALYLLGLPPEGFVTTCRYSTGSQSQENDAHMLEWLASRCIAKFFRTGFRGGEQHHMDCYYYQLHTPSFCWQSFDRGGDAVPPGLWLAAEGGSVVLRRVLPHAEKLRFAGRSSKRPGQLLRALFCPSPCIGAGKAGRTAENAVYLFEFLRQLDDPDRAHPAAHSLSARRGRGPFAGKRPAGWGRDGRAAPAADAVWPSPGAAQPR